MYVFGGTDGKQHFNDFHQFTVKGNKWEPLPSDGAPTSRSFHSVTEVNGKIYVFGGSDGNQLFDDLFCYDPGLCFVLSFYA